MSPNPPPPGGSLRSRLERLSPYFSRVNPPGEPGPDLGTVWTRSAEVPVKRDSCASEPQAGAAHKGV